MNKINLKIEGDYEFGLFSMFVCKIERNETSVPIFLTSEQTNLGLEDPEEPFEPILELLNILLDSGFSIHRTIEIVHGDESDKHLEFVRNFNNKTEEGWNSEIQEINLKYTNVEDHENSNIQLKSLGGAEEWELGYNFIIYTEANDMSPADIMKKLKLILKKS